VQQIIEELNKALAHLVKAEERLDQFDKSILAFDHACIYTDGAAYRVRYVLKMLKQEQEAMKMKEPWEMRRDEYAGTATGDEAEAAIKRLSIEMPGFVGRQRSMWPVGGNGLCGL